MPDWQEILARDGPGAWRAAYRITGNSADADECLQEAFLAALEQVRPESVRHWGAFLRCLAAARAVDRLRERRRDPRGEIIDWEAIRGPDAPPARALEEIELAAGLRDALARISPKQAEVFCLHILEGFSYEEIACQLAVSVNAVGVHLHRARKQLRELLAGTLDAPHAAKHDARGPTKEVP